MEIDISGFFPSAHDTILAGASGAVTLVGAVISAMFRGRSLSSFVDTRIRLVIETYEGQIKRLEERLKVAEAEIEECRKSRINLSSIDL